MAEGGYRVEFGEARRKNHRNLFKERYKKVSERVNQLQTAYYLLQGFTSVHMLCPEYLSVVDEISSMVTWISTSIAQEFHGDAFLIELEREREMMGTIYNIIWELTPAFADHVSDYVGRNTHRRRYGEPEED